MAKYYINNIIYLLDEGYIDLPSMQSFILKSSYEYEEHALQHYFPDENYFILGEDTLPDDIEDISNLMSDKPYKIIAHRARHGEVKYYALRVKD